MLPKDWPIFYPLKIHPDMVGWFRTNYDAARASLPEEERRYQEKRRHGHWLPILGKSLPGYLSARSPRALEGKARGKGKNVGIANIESSPSNENIVLHLWTVVMHALRPRILLSPTNDLCAQIRQFTRVSG